MLESPWISVLTLSNTDSQGSKRSKHRKTYQGKIAHVVEEPKKADSRLFFALNGVLEKWEMSPWKSLKIPWIFCSKNGTNPVVFWWTKVLILALPKINQLEIYVFQVNGGTPLQKSAEKQKRKEERVRYFNLCQLVINSQKCALTRVIGVSIQFILIVSFLQTHKKFFCFRKRRDRRSKDWGKRN